MRGIHLRTGHQCGHVLRRGRAVERSRQDGREIRHLLRRGGFKVRRHREQVVVSRGIQKGDFRAAARGLAHAVRQHRRLTAQVRPDHEQRVEFVDGGDGEAAEAGRHGVRILVAEVRLAQAMVDVVRTERTRDLRQ
jgi:hypothetical protein